MACDISFERYFWKKKDGVGKKRKSAILISVFGPFNVLGAPLHTHLLGKKRKSMILNQFLALFTSYTPHFIPIFQFIQIVACDSSFERYFLKENWWDRKKRKLMILILVFAPQGHFIWKVFLKEKRWNREKRKSVILIKVFGPFRVLGAPFYTHFFDLHK